MEIKLDIEAAQLADKMEKIFDNLSPEQSERIAIEVMTKFLNEPHCSERQLYERQQIEKWRKEKSWYKDKTDAQFISDYEFQNHMRSYKTTKEKMVEMITYTAISHFTKRIDEMVENDTQIKEIFEQNKGEIKESFPQYIQAAMTTWFIGNMQSMQDMLRSSFQQSGFAANATQKILDYMNKNGHSIPLH